MQTIKSLRGEINSRCFLTVLLVKKPGHLIEFRRGEVQYFIYSIIRQIQTFLRRPNK